MCRFLVWFVCLLWYVGLVVIYLCVGVCVVGCC